MRKLVVTEFVSVDGVFEDPGGSEDKIHVSLNRDGVLILDEFAWDQMDQATARWYVDHLSTPADEHDSLLPGKFPHAWISEHEEMHDSRSIRSALADLFDEAFFEATPYIANNYLKRTDLIEEELHLIRAGEIRAIGFRYVGIPK